VILGRAGTSELKAYYLEKVRKLKDSHENLGRRIRDIEIFPEAEAAIYYSSWIISRFTFLFQFPISNGRECRPKVRDIGKSAQKALHYLDRLGLAQFKGGEWKSTNRQLHLPRESHFINTHHNNWRRRAVDNSLLGRSDDIHYTAVSSLARKDIESLRQLVLSMIDKSREIIAPSPEEELVCLGIDLFVV